MIYVIIGIWIPIIQAVTGNHYFISISPLGLTDKNQYFPKPTVLQLFAVTLKRG